MSTQFGTSLTSKLAEKIPLANPLKQSSPIASKPHVKNDTSDTYDGYMMMSPVSTETDRIPRSSWSSEKIRANSVETPGGKLCSY